MSTIFRPPTYSSFHSTMIPTYIKNLVLHTIIKKTIDKIQNNINKSHKESFIRIILFQSMVIFLKKSIGTCVSVFFCLLERERESERVRVCVRVCDYFLEFIIWLHSKWLILMAELKRAIKRRVNFYNQFFSD